MDLQDWDDDDRHCGLDPQSRWADGNEGTVILGLIQNPQGGDILLFTLTFDSSPIKGEGRMQGTVILDLIQNPQGGELTWIGMDG